MLSVMNNTNNETKFEQVCVWPFTLCPPKDAPSFEQFFADKFGVRVRYIGENKVNNKQTDTLFYIASEDIGKFAVPRMSIGIRWLEDVKDNVEANGGLYPFPEGVKRCW